jgi:diguanylate cyclase (GGDEF)-like protein/PAS domain S-box-containing protein
LEVFFGGYRDQVTSEAADRATALVAHLEASEERYRALVDTAGDAIVSADADGDIISFNRAAEHMFGWPAVEALGQPLTILMPERFHEAHEAGLRRYVETTEGRLVGSTIELAGRRREGGEFPLEISLAAWRSSGKQFFTGVLRDITERKRVDAKLREATQRFEGAFKYAAIGMCLVSPDGRFLSVNDSLCRIVGYDRDNLIDKTFQDITHPEDLEADLELVGQVLEGELETYDMEKRYLHADGHIVWVLLSVSIVRDPEGGPLYFVSQIQDITARKQAEAELRASEQRLSQLALTDDLTGLANRRRFLEELERHTEHCTRYGWRGAVMILDLDSLKAINDTLGHAAGDQLIKQAGARLRKRLRASDFLGRLGGDEFAVLLPEADADAARAAAQGLVEELAAQEVTVGSARAATTSVGVALIGGLTTAEEALMRADIALYEAKAAGGNRFAFYDPGLDERFTGALAPGTSLASERR